MALLLLALVQKYQSLKQLYVLFILQKSAMQFWNYRTTVVRVKGISRDVLCQKQL